MGSHYFVEYLLIHLGSHRHRALQRLKLPKHLDHSHRRLSRVHVRCFKVPLMYLELISGDRLVGGRSAFPQLESSGAAFDQRFQPRELYDLKLGDCHPILKDLASGRNPGFGIRRNLDRSVQAVQNRSAIGGFKPTGWCNPEGPGPRVGLSASPSQREKSSP
jgi:hypothetical protein